MKRSTVKIPVDALNSGINSPSTEDEIDDLTWVWPGILVDLSPTIDDSSKFLLITSISVGGFMVLLSDGTCCQAA